MNEVALIGFAPDADPTTKGVMVDCNALIPSPRGFRALPSLVSAESGSVFPNATVIGSGLAMWAGRNVFLAGTPDKVYALQDIAPSVPGTAWANWVDVSRPGDATMTGPRLFEQFGDFVISAHGHGALSDARTLQAYCLQAGGNTAFAAISGAPMAPVIVVASRFVVALGTYSDGYWDGWKCCARDNHADWVLSAATQCTQGRLVDTPGPILAGSALDDDLLAFKNSAAYLGRYVGGQEVWAWDPLPFNAGCISARGVCKDGSGKVYFLDSENLHMFDGALCTPLMTGRLARWYVNSVVPYLLSRQGAAVVYDAMRGLIWVELQANTGYTYLLSFDPRSGRWTKTQMSTGVLFNLNECPVQLQGVGVSALTPSTRTVGIFKSNRSLAVFGGEYASAAGIPRPTFTTGDFGDISVDTELRAARVKFTTPPPASSCTPMHRANLDATLTTAAAVARQAGTGRYDLWQIDRWHRLRFDLAGDCEFSGFAVDVDAVDEQ